MDLGLAEILVIAILALLFFGPKRLPASIKSIKDAVRGFKNGLKGEKESHQKSQEFNPTNPIVTPSYNPKAAPQLSHSKIIDAEEGQAVTDYLKPIIKTPRRES